MSTIGTAGFRIQVVEQATSDKTNQAAQGNKASEGAADSTSSIANSVANAAAQRVASPSVIASNQTSNTQTPELLQRSLAATGTPSLTQAAAKSAAEQAAKAAAAAQVAQNAVKQNNPPPPPQDGPHINADGQVTGTLLNIKA